MINDDIITSNDDIITHMKGQRGLLLTVSMSGITHGMQQMRNNMSLKRERESEREIERE